MSKKPRILIDMDEVLCDFTGGACRLWGITREQLDAQRQPGDWCIVSALSKAIHEIDPRWASVPLDTRPQLSLQHFWTAIQEKGEAFWTELDELHWMAAVIAAVEDATDDWHIVSTPSHCPSSYSGKAKWLKKVFGSEFDRFALTPYKEIFAGPNVYLIDDREYNCEKFNIAGGHAILFPSYGNSLHAFSDNPVEYVQAQLDRI